MAYYNMNIGLLKKLNGARYLHRRAVLLPVGGAGVAVATATVALPCPGRLIAYEIDYTSQAATTDILFKEDTTSGNTIKTITNVNTDIALKPLGTTAGNVTDAATAATDAFSGGFPVRTGVFIDVAQADDNASGAKSIVVDLYFRLCSYLKMDLVAQSGADGTGAATRFVDFAGAGSLAAVATDYQNTPATADLLIKADSTTGVTLWGKANSQTDTNPHLVGRPGEDEGVAATAATDGTEGANMFKRGLFFDLAQTDIFTSSNERTIVECWIDQ